MFEEKQKSYNGLRIGAICLAIVVCIFNLYFQAINIEGYIHMYSMVQPDDQVRVVGYILQCLLSIVYQLLMIVSAAMLFVKQRRYLIIPFGFLFSLSVSRAYCAAPMPSMIFVVLIGLTQLLSVVAVQSNSVRMHKIYYRIWWLPMLFTVLMGFADILYGWYNYTMSHITITFAQVLVGYLPYIVFILIDAASVALCFLYLRQSDKYQLQQLRENSLSVN